MNKKTRTLLHVLRDIPQLLTGEEVSRISAALLDEQVMEECVVTEV